MTETQIAKPSTEDDSGDDGDADREAKHTDVEPGVGAWGQCVRRHREKRANGAERERKTHSRRDKRQHQTLGDQLLHEATRGRTDGRAHRNLVLACRRADEQQHGGIRAANQQYEEYRAAQHPQHLTARAVHEHVTVRKEPETITCRGERRVGRSKCVAERVNVVGALLWRQPGAQPPYRLGVVPLVGRIDRDHQRRQIADVVRRRRKPELAREHTDDGVRRASEPDLPAEDGGIGGKASTP
jgi:hypothetical protein